MAAMSAGRAGAGAARVNLKKVRPGTLTFEETLSSQPPSWSLRTGNPNAPQFGQGANEVHRNCARVDEE
jgi:hypothetical protein